MPRVIKPEDYQQKRGEILDAAQRLIYTRGYEQMTIQDILEMLNISKGAFYHYFDSKPALLEALVERMMDEATRFLTPIVDDPRLPALQKLEVFMNTAARWKAAQKSFLIPLLHTWYADHNAIVRQKLTAAGSVWIAPFLEKIIAQGMREGSLQPAAGLTRETAQVIVSLMTQLGEAVALPLLALRPEDDAATRSATVENMKNTVIAYRSAIERVLGAQPGSVSLFDMDIFEDWVQPDTTPEANA